jgi:phospholipid transport system transporter-binding protein
MAPESVLSLGPIETLQTARQLVERARSVAAMSSSVVVDCSALEQADASAMQVLLALRNATGARGGTIRVLNVPAELAWRFDFAGLPYTTA